MLSAGCFIQFRLRPFWGKKDCKRLLHEDFPRRSVAHAQDVEALGGGDQPAARRVVAGGHGRRGARGVVDARPRRGLESSRELSQNLGRRAIVSG